MSERIRVLVVDDSAFNRRTIIKMLETVPGVEIAGYAVDGEEALRKILDLKPDLITLDLEMPRMDGFTLLRIVMQRQPTPIIVVSARSEDETVFKALEFGAVEFVAKPSARISHDLFNIREDLTRKVREIAHTDMTKVVRRQAGAPAQADGRRIRPMPVPAEDGLPAHVVLGASTGGPPALQAVLAAIRQPIPVGMAVCQHMPPGFTRTFAERLDKFCPMEIREARSGDVFAPGRVLIAPGGRNLVLRRRSHQVVAEVTDPAAGQRYVPSVDALFSSASEVFGDRLLGVVLTGMGNDGAEGVREIKKRGGQVLAEAEDTSVVFGMPQAAIATGKVDKVLALPSISGEILRRCGF